MIKEGNGLDASGAITEVQVLADVLNDLLSAESHSLTQHLDEVQPYLSQQTYEVWGRIQQAGRISHSHAQRLTQMIEDLGQSPLPGVYPVDMAGYQYLGLPVLVSHLIEEKRLQAAGYEKAIQLAQTDPELTQGLRDMLGDVRSQLEIFESVSSNRP